MIFYIHVHLNARIPGMLPTEMRPKTQNKYQGAKQISLQFERYYTCSLILADVINIWQSQLKPATRAYNLDFKFTMH